MKPLRGEVWSVNFAPATGAEIQKVRLAVVMNVASIGRLPLCIVVPITNWQPRYEAYDWIVRLPLLAESGLTKESGADAFQVKSLSDSRFIQKLGDLPDGQVAAVADAIALCVGFTASEIQPK